MDVWGNFSTPTYDGQKYFPILIDDYSRYTWIYLLTCKSECFTVFTKFYAMISTQFQTSIKTVRTDNGREFFSSNMKSFLELKGIKYYPSCSHTPQQIGVVERKHQHILNVFRSLQMQSSLHIKLWRYSILHVVYIINRLSSKIIDHKTPYQLIHNKILKFNNLNNFGCQLLCHNHCRKITSFHLEPKGVCTLETLQPKRVIYFMIYKDTLYSPVGMFYLISWKHFTTPTLKFWVIQNSSIWKFRYHNSIRGRGIWIHQQHHPWKSKLYHWPLRSNNTSPK